MRFQQDGGSQYFEEQYFISETSLHDLYNIVERHTGCSHFEIWVNNQSLNRDDKRKKVSELGLVTEHGSITLPFIYKYRQVAISMPDSSEVTLKSNSTVYELLVQLADQKGCGVLELLKLDNIALKTDYQFDVEGEVVTKAYALPRTPSSSPQKYLSASPSKISLPRKKSIVIKHQYNPALSFSIHVEVDITIEELKKWLTEQLKSEGKIAEFFDIYKEYNIPLENSSLKGGIELKYEYKEITLVVNGVPTKVRLDNKISEIRMSKAKDYKNEVATVEKAQYDRLQAELEEVEIKNTEYVSQITELKLELKRLEAQNELLCKDVRVSLGETSKALEDNEELKKRT